MLHRDETVFAILPQRLREPGCDVQFGGAERRAKILNHGQRPCAVGRALLRGAGIETDQALVVRLVVPMREEYRQQPQRSDVRRWRVRVVKLEPSPSGVGGRLDGRSGEAVLDRRPGEVGVSVLEAMGSQDAVGAEELEEL